MKVMLIKPSKEVEIMNIKNDIISFQQIVQGYVEPVYIEDFIFLVNEEGKLINLPPNILGLVGNIVVVRNGEDDFESLTDDDIKYIMNKYELR